MGSPTLKRGKGADRGDELERHASEGLSDAATDSATRGRIHVKDLGIRGVVVGQGGLLAHSASSEAKSTE